MSTTMITSGWVASVFDVSAENNQITHPIWNSNFWRLRFIFVAAIFRQDVDQTYLWSVTRLPWFRSHLIVDIRLMKIHYEILATSSSYVIGHVCYVVSSARSSSSNNIGLQTDARIYSHHITTPILSRFIVAVRLIYGILDAKLRRSKYRRSFGDLLDDRLIHVTCDRNRRCRKFEFNAITYFASWFR